jgi:two-component system sensor histidine kinase/response regulator
MEISKRVHFLKEVGIFSESPEYLLFQIAENLIEIEVPEGDHIVLKGEMGDSMYILIEGRVKVHDGQHVFSVLKKGDVFGKYYLIDRKERSATVTALLPSHLFLFHQDIFYEITKNESTVVKGILKALVGRLRDMNIVEEQMASQNQEILRQKNELERQKKELLELNATKDKFFSIIAHDLRSPITTLISLSEVLKTDLELLTTSQQTEILNSLYDLSRNYLKLLDNLLQWARMQTGRLKAEPEKIRMDDLIREAVGFFQVYARDKQISLEYEDQTRTEVVADRNMIKTILRNLISNAIKYTAPNGRVAIHTKDHDRRIEVIIKDDGVGMTGEILEKLFHIDKTSTTRGTADEKGTGLGLILCKEFVEKNGGLLQVESERGVGSTFRFTLPKSESQ